MSYDVELVRALFPALSREENGLQVAYLDGPGGTQVPGSVITAMTEVLRAGVSNLGGGFGASDDAERMTAEARTAMASFLNASPAHVSFGQNMTSITFAVSRALGRDWKHGDSIVLTSLDHDANFTPWVMTAADSGVEVRVAEFDPETGILDAGAVVDLIDDTTRLVAIPLASNALGTVVDVAAVTAVAHEFGATVFVDAVHAGPHHLIDVAEIDCDLLVVSAYKFFGPHTGILYGKPEVLSGVDAYKVRPAPSDPPGKWETGTQSFESMAGVTAAVDYIASLGDEGGRRGIESAFAAIGEHERTLGRRFLDGIDAMGHVAVHGPDEMGDARVTTFAIAVEGLHPDRVAARFAAAAIYVWSGHYYAVNVMDRLGVLEDGGLVRIGFCHYNTVEEVDRTLEVLASLG